MSEQEAVQAVSPGSPLLDTLLNISVFIFIGILIWLCTRAPVCGDLEDAPTRGTAGSEDGDQQA
jgi:hypothetical protein